MTFQIHKGEPINPGEMQFYTGSSSFKESPQSRLVTEHYVEHPIRRLWGLSWNASWLLGFITFGKTTTSRKERREPIGEPDADRRD